MQSRRWVGLLAVLVIAGSSAHAARACTRPMPMAEMAEHSAQVLTVRVERAQSRWADEPRRIETELTLVVEDALKGQRAVGERFTITAPGGAVGEWEMRLCCAPKLEPGKSYVLFLLPQYRTHPVVGMSRGAFELVEDGAGARRMMSVDGAGVVAIDGDGLPVLARGRDVPVPRASHGVRVVDVPRGQAVARAMTYDTFKAELAPVLAVSRAFPAGGPVGQRIEADLSPVPMVTARAKRDDEAPLRAPAAQAPVQTAPPRKETNQ